MLHDLTSLWVSYVLAISARIFASLSKKAFIAGEFTVAASRCPSSYPRFLLRSYCSLKVFSTSPSSFFNIVSLASSTLLSTFEKSTSCTFSSNCCTFCRVSFSALVSAFAASALCVACLSALFASSAANASFVAAFCSSVCSASFVAAFSSSALTLSALAFVASVSRTVCSCCFTSVFTLALRSSSACLSALVVSSVCSFAASGCVAALTAAVTCACVWYFPSSFVHR